MEYTWTGAVDNDWNNADNWDDENGSPAMSFPGSIAGDEVIIDINATITIPTTHVLASLKIDNSASLTLDTGANQLTVTSLTLNGNLTFTGSSITLGTVTGANHSLIINGNAVFNGAVSGVTTLSVSGDSEINAASITTTDAQNYIGTVTLGGTGTRTLQGTTITLDAITGAGHNLTITGNAVFGGNVGGITTLSVTGTSTIGGNINTVGTQTYNGAVTLTGDRTFAANAGSLITFGGTVESNNAAPHALTVTTGNVVFNGTVGANANPISTLTVNGSGTTTINAAINYTTSVAINSTGTTAINANVTTTGTAGQTYTGPVVLGNNITFTGAANSTVRFANTVNSNNATAHSLIITTANARFDGIVGSAGNPIDSVSVAGTSAINANITTTGNQIYTEAVTLGGAGMRTLNAGGTIQTTAAVIRTAATGAVVIEAAGNITIGNGINAGTNAVTLESTGGNININGAISAFSLSVKVPKTSPHRVTLNGNGNIGVTGTVINECPASITNVIIYIQADTFDALSYTGTITPGPSSQLCFDVNSNLLPSLFNVVGERYHTHISISDQHAHLVYGPHVPDNIPYPYAYINSSTASAVTFSVNDNYNIYIVDVDDVTRPNYASSMSFTVGTAGYIEIRGKYTSSGTLNLYPGNSTVRFVDSTSPTELNLPSFSFTGTINLGGGTSTPASITTTTGGITLRTITANGNGDNHLTLNSGAGNQISILGAVGASGNSVGNLTVNNSGQYTQNGAVTANSFRQTGAGDVSLGADIAVTAADKTNAVISFESEVTLTTDVTLAAPSTGGTVRLTSGVTGYTLTLKGGSSTAASLELDQDSGSMENIDIADNSFVTVRSNKTIRQNGVFTLTLQNGAALDTSAGSWHMGTSATSNDFAGINGTLILGTESKLIGGNVNLAGSFTVNNADWAAIAARGDVEIGGSVNFSGVHPQLIIEMAGSGSQRLITAQPLGSFHVEPGSTTNLTHDLTITGEVQIEYPGILDAGGFNIVMQAGLNGTKDVGSVNVGRWIILNAPETISAGSVSTYNMNAFRQNHEGSVTFQKMPSSGDPVFFEIIGNTAWQKFICNEAGSVIQFSMHPHQHVFIDKFEIKGTGTPGGSDYSGYITLTRLPLDPNWKYVYDGSPPGTDSIPNAPASRNLKSESENEKRKFWNFNLITPGFHGQRLMDIEYVTIYFSHAWNQRIPISTEIMHLNAVPYYKYDSSVRTGYFNNDWVEVRKIIYSFAEDSNGNGKVDRIRVQTNVSLNGDFTRFNVQVEGFRVDATIGNRNTAGGDTTPNGFDRVDEITGDAGDDSSFYIYLQEPANLYDGQFIKWWVTENTDSLMDSITQTMPVGDPITGDPATDEYYTTINTIPPRVSYTLTLPGYNKTFVQMSQPVQRGPGANITGDRVTSYIIIERTSPYNLPLEYRPFDAPVVPYNVPVPGGENSYLLTLDSSPSVSDLAKFPPVGDEPAGYYFTMDNDFRDLGVRALDWNDEKVDETTYMYYPSPRYPVDWNYSGYATYKGNGHIPSSYGLTDDSDPGNPNPDIDIFLPPNRVLTPQMIKDLEAKNPVTPSSFGSGVVNRRVTDVLISRPPANNDSENYFAWPVWARYQNNANPDNASLSGDFWSQRNTDNGVIWTFDGAAFLEARGFDLQAHMNSALTGNLELFWTTDIPAEYRVPQEDPVRGRSTGGLWLPYPADLHNRLFYHFVPLYNGSAINQTSASAPVNPPLFNFALNGENSSGKKLEFVFRINGGPPSDLFIARLDIPQGGAIPENWYTLVRPFGFDIQDIRLQRGGVTVLNNVINSDARENAFIRYHLVRPGRVTVQVYTLDGTLVKSLRRNEYREAGEWTDAWDGSNNSGRAVARAMYFVRVVAPDIDEIRKIMVVR